METRLSPGMLLDATGELAQAGWAPQPVLDCNLEAVSFYLLRPLQRFRIKRWDYYAVFTPSRFFSVTIADVGYAGNLFAYTLDFQTGVLHEDTLILPFGKGITLPRNPSAGESCYKDSRLVVHFTVDDAGCRQIHLDWPGFDGGRGLRADLQLASPPGSEALTLALPIERRRFYYNCKINCLPASGVIQEGQNIERLDPGACLGSLDWGRGVWPYRTFWNWASASAYLPDGRRLGWNLGQGFGDRSQAGENCIVLDGRIHKLEAVDWDYTPGDYLRPWRFADRSGRVQLEFTPFKERVARTNLGIILTEVHQMFGRYRGWLVADDGETIEVRDVTGFAEEHHARW